MSQCAHRRPAVDLAFTALQQCIGQATRRNSGASARIRALFPGRNMILQEDAPVDIATPSGPMRTYVYRPVAPGRYPGLVFFSAIFRRTGPIKRTAALLAGHGFVVTVPEIVHELEPPGAEW